jgi:Family of unknown function (DUF5317)
MLGRVPQRRLVARYLGCVWFAAVAAGLALAIVVLTPGGPKRLWRAPILSVWMLGAAVAIQLIVAFVDFPEDRIENLGFGLLMASYALLLAFCFVNIRVRGMWLVAVGVALNTVVVGLNEGMPTPDNERTTPAGATVDQPIERTVKQRPESDDDLLGFLGDVIEIPDPIDNDISIGDILISIGGIYVCFRLTRRPSGESADEAIEREPEGEFASFWSPASDDDAPTEEIAKVEEIASVVLDDLRREDDGTELEPEPALIVWRDRQANGALGPEPPADTGAADPVEPDAADDEPVEAPLIEAGLVQPEPIVLPPEAVVVQPASAAGNDHPPSKLAYDSDELERKLAASENDVTALRQNRRPEMPVEVTEPAPEPVSFEELVQAEATPAPLIWSKKPPPAPQPPPRPVSESDASDDASDDPIGRELEKLFSRLSRGPGEQQR